MDFSRRSLEDRLKGKRLAIATPCYGGQLFQTYQESFAATQLLFLKNGLPLYYLPTGGDSLVQRARNVLVARFLESDATHLLFIDADIGWQARDVIKLLAGDKDICGAVYPKKGYPAEWPMNWLNGEELTFDPDTTWIKAKDLPTGFMMVSRTCIEAMLAKHPEWKCKFDPASDEEPNSWALFDCFIDDGIYLSEDFGFCRRAQADGFEVWLDPTIGLTHMGGHIFNFGAIADTLFPPVETKIEGWMSPAELRWLKAAAARMDSVVEIGSWKGRSTHALASACKGPVYAVDTWKGSPEDLVGPNAPHAEAIDGDIYAQFLENVKDCPNVRPYRGESVKVAEEPQYFGKIPVEAGRFIQSFNPLRADMVFIDGSHEYEAVKADIKAWAPKARRLICGHDWDRPGVQRAVKEAFGHRATLAAGSIWQVWL